MKKLISALLIVFSCAYLSFNQTITSYEGFLEFKDNNLKKIEALQEKEIKSTEDRFQIINLFDTCSFHYEWLIEQDVWYKDELVEILMDNYTYCIRKYPDRSDTTKITQYLYSAKQLGLCDYRYSWFIAELVNTDYREIITADPCLRKIVSRLEYESTFWDDTYISTLYNPHISDQEKIAGLSNLWSEVKYNFAYFDQIPGLNWDSLYFEFIPKVLATASTIEYYDSLQVFCSNLRDSHTQVYYPDEANLGRIPLRTKFVDGRVFIDEVFNNQLKADGIKKGLELLKINGTEINEYAQNNISRYISSSTDQDLLIRTYEYNLFFGNRNESLQLELRDRKGELSEIDVSRKLPYDNYIAKVPLEYEILDNNLGYLTINTFSSKSNVTQDFDKIFDKFDATDGLIIDIRNNGGGHSGKASYIFSCFIDTIVPKWKSETRKYLPSQRAWSHRSSWHPYDNGNIKPNGNKHYSKPIVILTSPRTISAAEDFCMLFDMSKRAIIIGGPTAGSTGQPLYFRLPGGGRARVCTLRSSYPNGEEFVGYGIQPDILVKQSANDFLEEKDPVLQEAMGYLSKK